MDFENIDVKFIGLVGFAGKAGEQRALGPVPDSLGITARIAIPNALNALHTDFIDVVSGGACVIVFGADADDDDDTKQANAIAERVAASNKFASKGGFMAKSLTFFRADAQAADECPELCQKLRAHFGLESGEVRVTATDMSQSVKYMLEGDEPLTEEAFTKFCDGVTSGFMPPFVKTQTPPEGNMSAGVPGLTICTAKTFDEIVLDEAQNVFVALYSAEAEPCVLLRPMVHAVARLLHKHGLNDKCKLRVCELDADRNDIDDEHFPEDELPNMKLFAAGPKDDAEEASTAFDTDENDPTVLGLVGFLAAMLPGCGEELAALAEEAHALDEVLAGKGEVKEVIDVYAHLLGFMGDHLTNKDKCALDAPLDALIAVYNDDAIESVQQVIDAVTKFTEIEVVVRLGTLHAAVRQTVSWARKLERAIGNHFDLAGDKDAKESVSLALLELREVLPEPEEEGCCGENKACCDVKKDDAPCDEKKKKKNILTLEILEEAHRKAMGVAGAFLKKVDALEEAEMKASMNNVEWMESEEAMEQLIAQESDAETAKHALVVVDFYARDAPTCRTMCPFFAELSGDEQLATVKFLRVDVDKNMELATDYFGVEVLPTVMFYKNGEELRDARYDDDDTEDLEMMVRRLAELDQGDEDDDDDDDAEAGDDNGDVAKLAQAMASADGAFKFDFNAAPSEGSAGSDANASGFSFNFGGDGNASNGGADAGAGASAFKFDFGK